MVRMLKALILLGAAVWSGPCPNPVQQWLLSPQCSVWPGCDAQTSKATPGSMFHGSALLTLPWDKRQLMAQCLFQAGGRHEYPEAPPYKPWNISWLLGWDQEPVWTPTLDPGLIYRVLSHLCLLGRQHCTSRLEKPTFEKKKKFIYINASPPALMSFTAFFDCRAAVIGMYRWFAIISSDQTKYMILSS